MSSLQKSYPAQTPGDESSISWNPLFFHGHAATLPGLPAPLLSQMSMHIKKISQDHGAVFLPLQNDLDQEAARSGPASITSDGIHLTPQGHRILADKLYKLIISER